jgi:hypothetical protein
MSQQANAQYNTQQAYSDPAAYNYNAYGYTTNVYGNTTEGSNKRRYGDGR